MHRSVCRLGISDWKNTLKEVFSFGRKEYDTAMDMKKQLLTELERVRSMQSEIKDTQAGRVPDLLKQIESEVQRLKDSTPDREEALKKLKEQLPKPEDLLSPERLNKAFDDAVRDPTTSRELRKVLAAFQAKNSAGGTSDTTNTKEPQQQQQQKDSQKKD